MTIVEQMAAFSARATLAELSESANLQLKIRILDALGCAFGALGAEPVGRVRDFVNDVPIPGSCTLINGSTTAPDRATLLNSALIRYLDFNDSYLAAGETCHPSDNLGAVLAAAELARADGGTLLAALAVAYQVQCRLSDAAPVRQRGFDHTTHLAYSVAAGVARALSLDVERTANAIAISGAALNALRVTRTGTLSNWKGLASAFTASASMQAVLLAQRGITGPAELIEGDKGFEQAISGAFTIDWEHERFDRIEHTVIKRYNAEVHAQTAINATLELQQAYALNANDVIKVEVDIFDVAHRIIGGGEDGDKMLVFSKEDADHSLPYLIAVALLDHAVTPAQFRAKRLQRPDVQALLCRVVVRPLTDYSERFPEAMPARVTLTLKDGRILTRECFDYPGFRSKPQAWEDAVAKFETLAAPHLSASVLATIASAVRELEHITTTELTHWLGSAPGPLLQPRASVPPNRSGTQPVAGAIR